MISIIQIVADFTINFISNHGYLAIFFLMAIESANIPFPSEIIMPFSGFLVYQGQFSFLGITLAGAFGNLVGSILSYYLGDALGRPIILAYGKYLLIPQSKFLKAEAWFKKHGHEAAFFGRLLPVIRTFISLPAGIAEMDIKKFSVYTFTGAFIWSALLGYVGIILGPNWENIIHFFRKIEIAVIAAFLLFVAWYVYELYKSR